MGRRGTKQQTASENFIMKNLMCTILKYNYEDEIKNIENTDLVKGTGTKRNVRRLLWRNTNKRNYSEDLGVVGEKVIKWILKE